MLPLNPIRTKPDLIDAPLHVLTAIVNPWRYRSRWALYYDFVQHMAAVGAVMHTVEVAYGERSFAVTGPGRASPAGHLREERGSAVQGLPLAAASELQLRTSSELWHKENALNLGFARLPADWKYAAWIDADVHFLRPDIVEATLHALQHWPIVQMWSRALDLGPTGHAFAQYRSFADCHLNGGSASPARGARPLIADSGGYLPASHTRDGYWHSGYAWAIRREAFDALGGLLDFAVLGAADYFMAWALAGRLSQRIYRRLKDRWRASRGYSDGYVEALVQWETRAAALRRNIGCVEGTLAHQWHGKKRRRGYNVRENVLIDNQFNPATDLRRDWQGLWQLHDDGSNRSVRLRDQVRAYFRSRDEDSGEHDQRELPTV